MNGSRLYDLKEVESILEDSEGRRPSGASSGGHTLECHVFCSNAEMLAKERSDTVRRRRHQDTRLAHFAWSTAFLAEREGRDDAVCAAHHLLNAPDGQKALGEPYRRRGHFQSWWGGVGHSFKMRYSSGQVVRTAPGTHAAICATVLPNGDLYIHTWFPILGSATQKELSRE